MVFQPGAVVERKRRPVSEEQLRELGDSLKVEDEEREGVWNSRFQTFLVGDLQEKKKLYKMKIRAIFPLMSAVYSIFCSISFIEKYALLVLLD